MLLVTPSGPDDWSRLNLAYLLAVLSVEQRWELASLHAALLRDHGRFVSARDVQQLYHLLIQEVLSEAAQAATHAREVGDP
jgi:ribulose-5-phosphate 4-epimerase/fuculose-1-phosphate aldolase